LYCRLTPVAVVDSGTGERLFYQKLTYVPFSSSVKIYFIFYY